MSTTRNISAMSTANTVTQTENPSKKSYLEDVVFVLNENHVLSREMRNTIADQVEKNLSNAKDLGKLCLSILKNPSLGFTLTESSLLVSNDTTFAIQALVGKNRETNEDLFATLSQTDIGYTIRTLANWQKIPGSNVYGVHDYALYHAQRLTNAWGDDDETIKELSNGLSYYLVKLIEYRLISMEIDDGKAVAVNSQFSDKIRFLILPCNKSKRAERPTVSVDSDARWINELD